MRLLLIDNYDSFTWNLVHLLVGAGEEVMIDVVRNDSLSVDEALARATLPGVGGIVLSPGPDSPEQAGICLPLVRAAAGRVPIFGVCLGMQVIAAAFGARIVQAAEAVHGTPHELAHDGAGLFVGLPSPLAAMRYHSLAVDPATLPDSLQVSAWLVAQQDLPAPRRLPMALRHRELPIAAVQFHPESIGTPAGHALAANLTGLLERGGARSSMLGS